MRPRSAGLSEDSAPLYVAGAGGGHRPVHVTRIGECLFGQGFAGCRIINDEPARAAIDKFSIDEVLPVASNLLSHWRPPASSAVGSSLNARNSTRISDR
jgi:hypothetical protein